MPGWAASLGCPVRTVPYRTDNESVAYVQYNESRAAATVTWRRRRSAHDAPGPPEYRRARQNTADLLAACKPQIKIQAQQQLGQYCDE